MGSAPGRLGRRPGSNGGDLHFCKKKKQGWAANCETFHIFLAFTGRAPRGLAVKIPKHAVKSPASVDYRWKEITGIFVIFLKLLVFNKINFLFFFRTFVQLTLNYKNVGLIQNCRRNWPNAGGLGRPKKRMMFILCLILAG
ncbi:hypothetical protein [Desulfatibacillum aliphaticivorans]|nr:hypothetical protein [Desulfatibacillum aliphaticivorans]